MISFFFLMKTLSYITLSLPSVSADTCRSYNLCFAPACFPFLGHEISKIELASSTRSKELTDNAIVQVYLYQLLFPQILCASFLIFKLFGVFIFGSLNI